MALSIAGSLARTRDANQHLEAAIELNYLRSAKPGTSQACQATDNRADARASPAAEDSAQQRSRADTGVNEGVLATAAGFDSPSTSTNCPEDAWYSLTISAEIVARRPSGITMGLKTRTMVVWPRNSCHKREHPDRSITVALKGSPSMEYIRW